MITPRPAPLRGAAAALFPFVPLLFFGCGVFGASGSRAGDSEEGRVVAAMIERAFKERFGRVGTLLRDLRPTGERWAIERLALEDFGGDDALYDATLDLVAELRSADREAVQWIEDVKCPPDGPNPAGTHVISIFVERESARSYAGGVGIRRGVVKQGEGRGCLGAAQGVIYHMSALRTGEGWTIRVIGQTILEAIEGLSLPDSAPPLIEARF